MRRDRALRGGRSAAAWASRTARTSTSAGARSRAAGWRLSPGRSGMLASATSPAATCTGTKSSPSSRRACGGSTTSPFRRPTTSSPTTSASTTPPSASTSLSTPRSAPTSGSPSSRSRWRRSSSPCACSAPRRASTWRACAPALSVLELRAKARRLKRDAAAKLGLVIVDYIQLMRSSEGRDNREQEISEISRSLKALAKELSVPVLALSQLNRQVESRTPPVPRLADLRESGAIEQDADVICFLYRDVYYNPEDTEKQGVAEVHIAK